MQGFCQTENKTKISSSAQQINNVCCHCMKVSLITEAATGGVFQVSRSPATLSTSLTDCFPALGIKFRFQTGKVKY